MPMLGHLAENGLIVHEEFREGNEAPASHNREFIQACKANMPKRKHIARLRADAATVMSWYRMRGEHSENRIKELKLGFGMERMPCGQFDANAVFFRIGCMAYNLFVMFKAHVLPTEWEKYQVQTVPGVFIRWLRASLNMRDHYG